MNPLPSDLQIYTTADGSPTLCFAREDGYVEKMHHSGGALSESLYIYHEALKTALDGQWPARVLSFGLGLGYNELIAVAECLRREISEWKIFSFEAHDYLRGEFARWLEGEDTALPFATVCEQVAKALEVESARLREEASQGLKEGRLELRGAFPQDRQGVSDCRVVFYDAFSNKMDTGPWREETLLAELGPCLGTPCILSTYAATGSLNRGLKALGFKLQDRSGFQGKRESTLAIRYTATS